jgi:hypothetical protein
MIDNKFQTQYPETYTVGMHALWTTQDQTFFLMFEADRSGLSGRRPTPKTKILPGTTTPIGFSQLHGRLPVDVTALAIDQPVSFSDADKSQPVWRTPRAVLFS